MNKRKPLSLNPVLVGRVISVHGIKGEIKILPYGVCEKKTWKRMHIKKGEKFQEYGIKCLRPHRGLLLASLSGLDNRDTAMELVGLDVFIDRKELPELPEGEYYQFELIGLDVITDNGAAIGKITGVFATGSNDVYVVDGRYGEVLLPAIKDVIVDVDVKKGRMIVHPAEGILPKDEI